VSPAAAGRPRRDSDLVSEVGEPFCPYEDKDISMEFVHSKSTPFLPAHALYVDHQREAIVLAIRGTTAPEDIVTDAATTPSPFMGVGRAHMGMATSALVLLGFGPMQMREAQDGRGWDAALGVLRRGARAKRADASSSDVSAKEHMITDGIDGPEQEAETRLRRMEIEATIALGGQAAGGHLSDQDDDDSGDDEAPGNKMKVKSDK